MAVATRVWFDSDRLWVELDDGRQIGTPLSWYPRLQGAKEDERSRWSLSGTGRGIHWDLLDEDLLVDGMLEGNWGLGSSNSTVGQ